MEPKTPSRDSHRDADFRVLYHGERSGDMFLVPCSKTKNDFFLLDGGTSASVVKPFCEVMDDAGLPGADGHIPQKIIVGLVITHSDSDHYYGMRAIVSHKYQAVWGNYWRNLRWIILPRRLIGERSAWKNFKKSLLAKVKALSAGLSWRKIEENDEVNEWLQRKCDDMVKVLNDCELWVAPNQEEGEGEGPVLLKAERAVGGTPDPSPTNASSVIIRYLDRNGNPYLLTGDAPLRCLNTTAVRYALEGRSQWFLIKIPHHGSINNLIGEVAATDEEALYKASKTLADLLNAQSYVITCKGDIHHPGPMVLKAIGAKESYTELWLSHLRRPSRRRPYLYHPTDHNSFEEGKLMPDANTENMMHVLNLDPLISPCSTVVPRVRSDSTPPSPRHIEMDIVSGFVEEKMNDFYVQVSEPQKRELLLSEVKEQPLKRRREDKQEEETKTPLLSAGTYSDAGYLFSSLASSSSPMVSAPRSSDPPTHTFEAAVRDSIPTPFIQNLVLRSIPTFFIYARSASSVVRKWDAKDPKWSAPTSKTLSQFSVILINPATVDLDMSANLHLQVSPNTEMSFEAIGTEVFRNPGEIIRNFRFNAKLSRSISSGISSSISPLIYATWDVECSYRSVPGSSALTVWISDLEKKPLLNHLGSFLDLSNVDVPKNSYPFFSVLPDCDTVGLVFTEVTPNNYVLNRVKGMPTSNSDSIPINLGQNDPSAGSSMTISTIIQFIRNPKLNSSLPLPNWKQPLAQSFMALGTEISFEKGVYVGRLSVLPSSTIEKYVGKFELVVSDVDSKVLLDESVNSFFHTSSGTSNSRQPSTTDFMPSLPSFLSPLPSVAITSLRVQFSLQNSSIQIEKIGASIAWEAQIKLPLGFTLDDVFFDFDVSVSPLFIEFAELSANVTWNDLTVYSTMSVPTDDTVGQISLDFEGVGQQQLTIQNAFDSMDISVLDELIKIPGLNLIAQMPLKRLAVSFDKDIKFDSFSVLLRSESSIDVCGFSLKDATISFEYYVGDENGSAYTVEFSGKANDSWFVQLQYSSSGASSKEPATFTGYIHFGEGIGVSDVLTTLFGKGQYSIESPPSPIDLFDAVKVKRGSVTIDVSNWKLYKASLSAGFDSEVEIAEMIKVSRLSLEYDYDFKATVKHTGSFISDIDLGEDWRVGLKMEKTEEFGWLFQASAFAASGGLDISSVLSKLVQGASNFASQFGGDSTPDQVSVFPNLKINHPSFRIQTRPLAVNLSAQITFAGISTVAEVVAIKSPIKWTYGVGISASGIGLHQLSDCPESISSTLGSSHATVAIVSNTLQSQMFRSELVSVNRVLAMHPGRPSALAMGSFLFDFTKASKGPMHSIHKILGIDTVSLIGLLSKSEVALELAIDASSSMNLGPISLKSVILYLSLQFSAAPRFTVGLRIQDFKITIDKQELHFNGNISGSLGVVGLELAVSVQLALWTTPFEIEWLTFQNIGLSAVTNPMLPSPLSGVGLSAGVILTKGGDTAKGIEGHFDGFVKFGTEQQFYVNVVLKNVTFAHIFQFIFDTDLPQCLSGLGFGFKLLEVYLANADMRLPDGVTHVVPTFRSRGEFSVLFMDLMWDIELPSKTDPRYRLIAAAKPINLLDGRLSLTAAPGWEALFKDIPLFLSIPKEYHGGPSMILNTAATESVFSMILNTAATESVLALGAKGNLFALEAQVSGSLTTSGASFQFIAGVPNVMGVELSCELNKSGFKAGGHIFINNAKFSTPAIKLFGVTIIGKTDIELGLDLSSNVWIDSKSMGLNFSGHFDFTFPIAPLHIVLPTLAINVPFKNLEKEALDLICSTIGSNMGPILMSALKNLPNLGDFLVNLTLNGVKLAADVVANIAKEFGRGIEEVAAILKKHFPSLGTIVNIISDVFNVSNSVARDVAHAVGIAVDDIAHGVTDAIHDVGSFFSGLSGGGGRSNARILKKLSLIGKNLDEVQATQEEILKGIDDLENDVSSLANDSKTALEDIQMINGTLWELHGEMELIKNSLKAINADLMDLHAQNLAINEGLQEMAGAVTWRELVLSVSPFVHRIQSAYLQLVHIEHSNQVSAWTMARDILNISQGIIPAMESIHAILIGKRAGIPGTSSLLHAWSETAKKLAKVDEKDPAYGKHPNGLDKAKFAGLLDQFLMHFQNLQKNGLVLLINALNLIGCSNMASSISLQVHQNMLEQLRIRNEILELPTAKNGQFFSKDGKSFIVLDQRIHELKDDAIRKRFQRPTHPTPPSLNDQPENSNFRLEDIAPIGTSFDSHNTKFIKHSDKYYMIVNTSARLMEFETINEMKLEISSFVAVDDVAFCQLVLGDPIDLSRSSTMGFAAKPQTQTGSIVWEEGENGPRIQPYDLIKTLPSGQLYVVFEKKLLSIGPFNNGIFSTEALSRAKLIPDEMAKSSYPEGPNFDSAAKLYKLLINDEINQMKYFFFQGGVLRHIPDAIVANVGFDISRAITANSNQNLLEIGQFGPDIPEARPETYGFSFAE